jgi:hypothetical protein
MVKQSYIDAFNRAITRLKSECGDYNKLVQALNDEVFNHVEDLNRQVEEINEVLGELRAIGRNCVEELKNREVDGPEPDLGDVLDSWEALTEISDMEECDGLEVDEIYHLTGRRGLLKDIEPLLGQPTEAETLIEQRIKALQAELDEVRKKRSLKP